MSRECSCVNRRCVCIRKGFKWQIRVELAQIEVFQFENTQLL